MGEHPELLSIRETARRLAAFEVSSEELVREALERAESSSDLNAFISLFPEDAIAEARALDKRRRRGEVLGPLHGIPITAKDLVWSKGRRTTSGSRIDAEFVPDKDAPALASLRGQGAVLLGKTNLHEFAYGVTNVNPHFGPARNPWDRSRISGGSSGGSAVALASGIGFGSIGTDTGGSIRIPSSFCGTVGLKPTYGRISREGVTPLSWSLDHVGPMARSVEDVSILYEAMSGEAVERPGKRENRSLAGLKLGIHERHFFENLAPEVEASVRAAIDALENLGAAIVEGSIPEIELTAACRNTIAFAEASSYHEKNLRSRAAEYGEDTRELLRLGLLIPAVDYLAALRARRVLVRAFRKAFEAFDVLAAPATPAVAPPIGAGSLDTGEELRSGLLRLAGPFNTVGFPVLSLPCGLSAEGMPIGLQLAAAPGAESLLLRVGRELEKRVRLGRAPAV
jgi:aspartyl-tRNA(Asn)/glutamyl-tRNA(Gln) amidotransferase subunit A